MTISKYIGTFLLYYSFVLFINLFQSLACGADARSIAIKDILIDEIDSCIYFKPVSHSISHIFCWNAIKLQRYNQTFTDYVFFSILWQPGVFSYQPRHYCLIVSSSLTDLWSSLWQWKTLAFLVSGLHSCSLLSWQNKLSANVCIVSRSGCMLHCVSFTIF